MPFSEYDMKDWSVSQDAKYYALVVNSLIHVTAHN